MTTSKLFAMNGKVAIVTGALGLIGRHHCKALAEAGANVIVADLDTEACERFAKELPTQSLGVKLDVTCMESIEQAKNIVISEFNWVDALINNAAINDMFEDPKAASEQSKFESYPLQLWQKSVDVNLTGVFLCSQILGGVMAEQKSGSIVNVASTYGMVAPNQSLYKDENGNQSFYKPPAYSATKGAIITFTKYLAAYWGNKGVRVNTLSPGGVQNGQDEHFVASYSEKTPLGRMASPTDYKGAVVFLASEASKYMTGANLVVDGGWIAW